MTYFSDNITGSILLQVGYYQKNKLNYNKTGHIDCQKLIIEAKLINR